MGAVRFGSLAVLWATLLVGAPGGPVEGAPPADAAPLEPASPGIDVGFDTLYPFGVRGLGRTIATGPDGARVRLAIVNGLEWLAAHQSPEGFWSVRGHPRHCRGEARAAPEADGVAYYDVGVTALSVLAFLGAGYAPAGAHPYAKATTRAIDWLRAAQDAEGAFGTREVDHFLYNTGYAALAMVEAYGMSGDARMRESAQRALELIAAARNPYFGWRYGVQPGDTDTSMTALMTSVLKAARHVNDAAKSAGLRPPFTIDAAAFDGAREWADKMTAPDNGRGGYVARGSGPARTDAMRDKFPTAKSEAMTAAAMSIRLAAAEKPVEGGSLAKGAALLLSQPPAWDLSAGTIDLYYWYYGTLVLWEIGGPGWTQWSTALAKALVDGQAVTGDVCDAYGSWPPADPWGPDGGRVYTTASAILCLAASSRYSAATAATSRDAALLLALEDPWLDDVVRAGVARAVAARRPAAGAVAVERALRAREPGVRLGALEVAARWPAVAKGLVPALAAMLGDAGPAPRAAAARALAVQSPLPARVVKSLVAAAKDPVPEVRAAVLAALGVAAPDAAAEALPALVAGLADASPSVRVAAAAALWRNAGDAERAVPVLAGVLQAGTPDDRAAAADALIAVGAKGAAAAPALAALLATASDDLRARVADALWAVRDPAGGDTVEAPLGAAIHAGLASPDASVRARSVALVGRLGPAGKTWLPAVARAATHEPAAAARREAVNVIGAHGPRAISVAAALHLARQDEDESVRAAAEAALDRLEAPPGAEVDGLLAASREPGPPGVRAAKALAALGPAAVPPLVLALASSDPAVVSGARRALVFAGAAAAPALVETARTGSPAARRAAAGVLGSLATPSPAVVDVLLEAVRDADAGVSGAAGDALVALAPRATAAFEARVVDLAGGLTEADPARRRLFARLLATLGPAAGTAVPALVTALGDADDKVAAAAREALASVGGGAAAPLVAALRGGGERQAMNALETLRRLPAPALAPVAKDLVPALVARLPAEGAHAAIATVSARVGRGAVEALKGALRDPSSVVRIGAARALGALGRDAKGALGALKDARGREKDARTLAVMDAASNRIQKGEPPDVD